MRSAEHEIVRGDPGAGNGSILALRDGRVVGVATCNRPREARAAMRLIRAGGELRAEELADDATDLRRVPLGGAA